MKRARFLWLATLGLAAAAGAGDIRFNIEEPVAGGTYTGIGNLRGWAVSSSGVAYVQLYVDGVLDTTIPSGGARNDVPAVYPDYPEADRSGFSMAYSYSKLTPGQHEVTIRVVDKDGDWEERTVAFQAERFFDHFIEDPNQVDGSEATLAIQGDCIQIQGLKVEGSAFDTQLCWNEGSQGLIFSAIDPADDPLGGGDEGACVTVGLPAGYRLVKEERDYEGSTNTLVNKAVITTDFIETTETLYRYNNSIRGERYNFLGEVEFTYGSDSEITYTAHVADDLWYFERMVIDGTSFEQGGEPVAGVTTIEFNPALNNGPYRTFCQGATWEAPQVEARVTYTQDGQDYQWVFSEGNFQGQVIAIDETIEVPAGRFTTVHVREQGSNDDLGAYTRDYWVDVQTGIAVYERTQLSQNYSEIKAQSIDRGVQ